MQICLLLLIGLEAGFALRLPAAPTEDSNARLDIHVINMDKRKDRCMCLRSQLMAHLPQNPSVRVFRQAAAGPNDCPNLLERHEHKAKYMGAKSLFCSNFKIWEKAHNTSDADFIVILEDDAMLTKDAYTKLQSYLSQKSQCAFDYLVIDPVLPGSWSPDIEKSERTAPMDSCQNTFKLAQPKKFAWAETTMTVIRKDFLPVLLEKVATRNWVPMDNWWQSYLTKDHKAYAWKAGLVKQASVGHRDDIVALVDQAGCQKSVMKSDITKNGISNLKEEASSEVEDKDASSSLFQC